MNIDDLKLKTLGIDKNIFRTIFTFIDYGNVNYWYEKDQRDAEEIVLQTNQKLIVDIKKLADFTSIFSEEKRFYYGWDNRKASSWHIAIKAEQNGFIKKTKPIQFIKHFLGLIWGNIYFGLIIGLVFGGIYTMIVYASGSSMILSIAF